MRAVIKLELIGDNYIQHLKLIEAGRVCSPRHVKKLIDVISYGQKGLRPWVARITGYDAQYGLAREFVSSARDYSFANSIGSRGIFEYFALTDGIYEVNECIRLGQARRYFIRVKKGTITEITREEVDQCLTSDTLESAS